MALRTPPRTALALRALAACCMVALAAAPSTATASGLLPPGWHRRQLDSGQPYFLDATGSIHWALPPAAAAADAADARASAVPPGEQTVGESSGAHRRLEHGASVVANLGGWQLVRVARTHDEGYVGGVSYTVTTASGHHRRLSAREIWQAKVEFLSPASGVVLVAAGEGEEAAANLTATLTSEHLELGTGYQLCVELFGAPLVRRADGSTPRVDAAAYAAGGDLESMSVGCFDELQPLELEDLPPGHFRLFASIHGGSAAHPPNATHTVELTVLSVADTLLYAGYDWQELAPWQTAAPELEYNASTNRARVPPQWELHEVLAPPAFGSLTMAISRATTVRSIRAAALKVAEAYAAEDRSENEKRRCKPGHVHQIAILLNGTALADEAATAESLDLWRQWPLLSVQVRGCEESPELRRIKGFVKRRSLDPIGLHDEDDHPAQSLPSEPEHVYFPGEEYGKLRMDASLARWAGKERAKLHGRK